MSANTNNGGPAFARKLERERDEAKELAQKLQYQLSACERDFKTLAGHHNEHCTCMEIY